MKVDILSVATSWVQRSKARKRKVRSGPWVINAIVVSSSLEMTATSFIRKAVYLSSVF